MNIFDYQLPSDNYQFEVEFPADGSSKKIIKLVFDDRILEIVIDKDQLVINS